MLKIVAKPILPPAERVWSNRPLGADETRCTSTHCFQKGTGSLLCQVGPVTKQPPAHRGHKRIPSATSNPLLQPPSELKEKAKHAIIVSSGCVGVGQKEMA